MTVTIKQEHIYNYYVCIELVYRYERPFYSVSLTEYGRTIKGNVYYMHEKKNAMACYSRYKKWARDN